MNANILLVCYLSFHWMLFFAYFSVWFGVSRDARPVEAFFNSNTCIIWNALTELSALTLISVFNFLYIYLSFLSTYISPMHLSACNNITLELNDLCVSTLCFVVRMESVIEEPVLFYKVNYSYFKCMS